jgi:hypothetical protein
MKQSKSLHLPIPSHTDEVKIRLDYLTNVLGFDAASSKKLIVQKQKGR